MVRDENTISHHPPARRSLGRSAAYLAMASLGLLLFILGLGDYRRQRNSLEQAKWHAAVYQRRLSDGSALPLNLEPEMPPEDAPPMIKWEFLDRDAARALRGGGEAIIAAHTAPVLQVLRRDGRAVVFFKDGRFEVRWVPLGLFETLSAAQRKRITDEAVLLSPRSSP